VDSLWNNPFFNIMPTILVGLIFWFIMRAIMRADRNERKIQAKVEAEERARLGLPADISREA
jgi:hypothetical protein